MTLKYISSGSRFEEIAGYSRAVIDDHYIHISGTVGIDPATQLIPPDVTGQMQAIFAIIEPILAAEGAALADVVRCRLYLTDGADILEAASVLRQKFADCRPANTTLICGIPAPGAKVEMEITACRPRQSL